MFASVVPLVRSIRCCTTRIFPPAVTALFGVGNISIDQSITRNNGYCAEVPFLFDSRSSPVVIVASTNCPFQLKSTAREITLFTPRVFPSTVVLNTAYSACAFTRSKVISFQKKYNYILKIQ